MLIASPIFMAILAFWDYKYEEREFEKRYNRKFWVLIVVLFALFPTIIEWKERYNLYNWTATNELEWNYTGSQNVEIEIEDEENIDEEIKDETVEDEEITEEITKEIIKEEKPVKKIKEEEIELIRSATVKDTSEKGYDLIDASRPVEKTNVVWIDQYLSNYKWNVIYSEDLKRDVDEPYYHVYTKIKKRTMLIDEESNFIIYFWPDLIGNILDIVYNDINEITQIRVLTDEKSERVIFETNILPWYDCYHTAWREGNDKLWWLNEDYMFMVDGKYAELNRKSISLLPNIQNWNSQESLRTNLPCSVTPLE